MSNDQGLPIFGSTILLRTYTIYNASYVPYMLYRWRSVSDQFTLLSFLVWVTCNRNEEYVHTHAHTPKNPFLEFHHLLRSYAHSLWSTENEQQKFFLHEPYFSNKPDDLNPKKYLNSNTRRSPNIYFDFHVVKIDAAILKTADRFIKINKIMIIIFYLMP